MSIPNRLPCSHETFAQLSFSRTKTIAQPVPELPVRPEALEGQERRPLHASPVLARPHTRQSHESGNIATLS